MTNLTFGNQRLRDRIYDKVSAGRYKTDFKKDPYTLELEFESEYNLYIELAEYPEGPIEVKFYYRRKKIRFWPFRGPYIKINTLDILYPGPGDELYKELKTIHSNIIERRLKKAAHDAHERARELAEKIIGF